MSTQTRKRPKWLAVIILAIIAIGLGVLLQVDNEKQSKPVQLSTGTLLPSGMPLAQFSLTNDLGKPFTNSNLKGHWSLLFFGFTNCPMICPTTLAELNKAYVVLQKDKVKNMPRVVFISVDPERDTTTKIHHYLANFNRNFIGVRGAKANIDALAKQMGIAYMKATKSGEKNYNIEHTGAVIVVNPQGEMIAVLTSPRSGATIASDFLKIAN